MVAFQRSKRFMSMLPFASGLRPPAFVLRPSFSGLRRQARAAMREEEWLIRQSDLFYYQPLRPITLEKHD